MQGLHALTSVIAGQPAADLEVGTRGTTVRRILARLSRLARRGEVSVGPVSQQWLMEYDRQSGRHGQL